MSEERTNGHDIIPDSSTTTDEALIDIDLPPALPAQLGELNAVVKWWLESHKVTSAAEAPKAAIESTYCLLTMDIPEGRSDDLTEHAAAICAVLTNGEAVALTDWPSSTDGVLDHNEWMRQCAAIRDRMAPLRELRQETEALLSAIPEPLRDLATRLADDDNGCVIVDGPIAAACLLLAYEINPDCLVRIRPLQTGQSPVEEQAWGYLRLGPILPIATRYYSGELIDVAEALINRSVALASSE